MNACKPVVLLCLLSLAGIADAADAVISVTSLDDPPINDPSTCTLRQAFANVNVGGKDMLNPNKCAAAIDTDGINDINRIVLPPGTVKLNAEINHSANEVMLSGGTIDASHQSRLFRVNGDTRFRTDRMVLQRGFSTGSGGLILADSQSVVELTRTVLKNAVALENGGCVSFDGEFLTLSHVKIEDCTAENLGGAVYTGDGDVTIKNTRIKNNYALDKGGAIYTTTLAGTLEDSYVEFNHVAGGSSSAGGGIYVEGSLSLIRTRLGDNYTTLGLGGGMFIADGSDVSIRDSSISHNLTGVDAPGNSSDGGGIYSDGALETHSVSFENNSARGSGGAIYLSAATAGDPISLVNTMFAHNVTTGGAAALWVDNTPSGAMPDPTDPLGKSYKFKILNSTFKQNFGGPDIYLESGISPGAQDILFVNNNLWGVNKPACAGDIARLALKRTNDLQPGTSNVEWPMLSCGAGMQSSDSALFFVKNGWYFKMAYARSLPIPVSGDPVVCNFIGGKDMFGHPRQCLMGAVEKDAPSVPQPVAPG